MKSEPRFFSDQVSDASRFYRSHLRQKTESLLVVAGGKEICDPGYTVNRRRFPYYGIELVIAGKGTLELGRESYELRSGIIFCYGPESPHRISNDQRSGKLIKYFLDITGKQAERLLVSNHLIGRVCFSTAPTSLSSSFEELTAYGVSESPYSDTICSLTAEALIYKILQTAIPYQEHTSQSYISYTRSKELIERSYLSLNSLQEIAEHCGVGKAYLCRLFARFDHMSPYQYLMRRKMNHAADLLSSRGYQVKEVSSLLGFEDQFHFSRAFKRVMGESPRSFRSAGRYTVKEQ